MWSSPGRAVRPSRCCPTCPRAGIRGSPWARARSRWPWATTTGSACTSRATASPLASSTSIRRNFASRRPSGADGTRRACRRTIRCWRSRTRNAAASCPTPCGSTTRARAPWSVTSTTATAICSPVPGRRSPAISGSRSGRNARVGSGCRVSGIWRPANARTSWSTSRGRSTCTAGGPMPARCCSVHRTTDAANCGDTR